MKGPPVAIRGSDNRTSGYVRLEVGHAFDVTEWLGGDGTLDYGENA